MAAPATVDQLLDLVRKSGVADEKRLDAYLQRMRERIPDEPPRAAEVLVRDGIITQFQAENILAGKWRRFNIGKYKVLERLGSGGMGQVFLCEHKLMRRRVAVKVLPTAKARDTSALDRFYREARAAAALTHPNIVHAYDIDQDEDLHFIVMEYVDGSSFQDIVKKTGQLSVLRACHYIRQAALALQHAHEAGLVHRDIKPGNLLVDRLGVVKLLDLGLARFFHDEEDNLTKKYDDGVLGTADYLAPEQALDSHAADIRADIYSLGATFYFLLTGHPPFETANVTQKLMMHQFRNPKPIQEIRSDVPAGVLTILQKMMAKDPVNRYAIPSELADALTPFTKEAIAPPTESELPHLSPAATGQGPSTTSDAPDTTITKKDTPVSPMPTLTPAGVVKPASGGGGAPTPRPVVTPSPRPVTPPSPRPTPVPAPPRASATPATPAPTVAAAPAAQAINAEEPDLDPWQKSQAGVDTDEAIAKADTTPPSSSRGAKGRKKLQAPPTNKAMVIGLVIVVVVIPFFLVAAIGVAIWLWNTSPAPQPAPSAPPRLLVSKDPSKSGFRSIQLALRSAKAGSVIELWDEVYDENVVIEPGKGPTGVTIQAAPGREILWKPTQDNPNIPIIKLSRASDFQLKGKGITLDGTLDNIRRVNNLITIGSECGGLAIEDLEMRRFANAAVFIMNATGSADSPIKLSRLTTHTDPASEKPAAAISLDANPQVVPGVNDYIEIDSCKFIGLPAGKEVAPRDEKVLGPKVHWPGRK